MNLFVADPEWGWWIILYFFLGGIAAGAFFMATLIQLLGSDADRELSHIGYSIAFPLIVLCGLFLTVDLHRPERFWHMLFKSEVVDEALREGWPLSAHGWSLMVHAPMLKYWSPMSVGSWALTIFGLCAFLAFIGSLWPKSWFARVVHRGIVGQVFAVIGSVMGFFVAAYTGALLTATNQPIWSDSVWVAPLFLTSAASTGIAAMLLWLCWRGTSSAAVLRLERADLWALRLELVVFVIFLISLGEFVGALLHSTMGIIFVAGTLLLGILAPLAIHLRLGGAVRKAEVAAALLTLVGGLLLRSSLLTTPPELLRQGPAKVVGFGPEDGRKRGGGPGGDAGNQVGPIEPHSKAFRNP